MAAPHEIAGPLTPRNSGYHPWISWDFPPFFNGISYDIMHVSSGPKNDSGARFVLIGTNNPFSGSLDESP